MQLTHKLKSTDTEKGESIGWLITKIKSLSAKVARIKEIDAKIESNAEIVMRHDERLKQMITKKSLDFKEEMFKREVTERVNASLENFFQKITQIIDSKVSKEHFYDKLREKANWKDFTEFKVFLDQREDKLRLEIDATNNRVNQIIMQECPTRSEFLNFSK